MKITFENSKQVEESFYQAFCDRNIELMERVWDKSENAICIHPGSSRIYGSELIIASWQQIFSAQDTLSISITDPVYIIETSTAIHYVKENLSVDGKKAGSVLATNIYHQTTDGWKMIAHHASQVFTNTEPRHKSKLH